MSSGLNLRINGDIIAENFTKDTNGALLPSQDRLKTEVVGKRFAEQLAGRTGLDRRLASISYNSDVVFTNRPNGTTPVIMSGRKLFGPSPSNKMHKKELSNTNAGWDEQKMKLVKKRYAKIAQFQKTSVIDPWKRIEVSTSREKLIHDVEGDQMMTGGGYDNTAIGDSTKSGLNFIIKSKDDFELTSEVSSLVVEGSLKLRDYFINECGIRAGSLKPLGAHYVRFMQETDGMIGFPVYAKSSSTLTKDQSIRLLIESGVDTRQLVNADVQDPILGKSRKATVIDAVAQVLDNMTVTSDSLPSNVTLLTRIQRHGYTWDGADFVSKDGKTRSIYPNAALPGIQEAMTFQPFLEAIKEKKLAWMPSLQNRPTRTKMIHDWLKVLDSKDYDALAADWSKYDATVKGSILATVIYYAIRPLYHADWQKWIDLAIYSLVYKYLIVSNDLAEINNDLFSEAKNSAPNYNLGKFSLFGLVNGLISGAKFTHGGGSLYGELLIHYVMPKLIGYEPIFGPQAGDDTLLAYPKSLIDINSMEKTYAPIVKYVESVGLDINWSKQIWHQSKGEVVKIFLQDMFHLNEDIIGMGSAFRYHAAALFAEKDNGLSIAEQYLAGISKYNNGYDNIYIKQVLEEWFKVDDFIGSLFKEYGTRAFDLIVDSLGDDLREISQRVGLTYNWGMNMDDLANRDVPVLPIMAEVASGMSFAVSPAEAASKMDLDTREDVEIINNDPDLIDDDDDDSSDDD